MDKLHRIKSGIWALFFRGRLEAELDEELRHHIQLETEKNVRAGMSPKEARRKALVDFGGVERFREETRAARGTRPVEDLARDLRYALRRLGRAPGFTVSAVLCLGIGLGATAGVFSFFFGIVLRPLPFPEADRLVVLFETAPGFTRASPSVDDYLGWKENASVFSGLGAYGHARQTVTGPEGPEIFSGARVSHDLLTVLGIQPLLGRGFFPEDDGPAAPPVILLSHGLWQERFGGAADVLARTVTLDEEPHVVVGVLPPGFAFPEEARYWVPLRTAARPRGGGVTAAVGRLADGVSMDRARTDLSRVAAIMRDRYPEANAQREIAVRPLEEDFLFGLKTPVTLFLLVAGAVLLLATANVANLLLAQGTVRVREMVVRTALGAGRRRLLRQLLAESLVLAVVGGGVGVILGILGRDLYLSYLPEAFPYYLRFDMDGPVLACLAGLTLGAGILFGLAPALAAIRVDLFSGLRGSGEGGPGISEKVRLRRSLLGVQAGLAVAVLLGAGMAYLSMDRLRHVSPGLRPDGVLTLEVALSGSMRGDPDLLRAAFDEIRDRIAALPGVAAAAAVSHLPVEGAANGTALFPEGRPPPVPGEEPWILTRTAQPGYLDAMGIALLQGRDFREGEGAEGAGPVVLVNENFAGMYWPEGEALGKRIKYGGVDADFPWMEIVGVVADVRFFGLDGPPMPAIYEPFRQAPYFRQDLVVRARGTPAELAGAIRAQVAAVDPNAPVYAVRTMEEVIYEAHWRPIVLTRLLTIFSALAAALAALGVYGVVAFHTARRRREFGVRMALGAGSGTVVAQGLKTSLGPCLLGMGGGVAVALGGIRVASSQLYGVEGLEPGVAFLCLLGMTCVVLLAALFPARRAAGSNPADVLRSD